ncbi:MAG: lysophospholipid acyltransferase family protein [Pirellulales bacterium]|nr:lysophospholipid acyltransferase family protein [Pirellulales bacterium]
MGTAGQASSGTPKSAFEIPGKDAKRMKIRLRSLNKTAGLLAATTVRQWMSTLDYKAALYEPSVDPVHPQYSGQKIYIFWHEYILAPLFLRGHCNLAMLLSRHQDAEILSYAAGHLGFEFVRGSTSRGGTSALRELLRRSRHMNLTITPDGPRGPRRVLAQGPIYLASKLQMPLVLLGIGYDRPWRFNSWDRFALPRPYSRARGVISPALRIPPGLDREGIEHYRRQVEHLLNRLTCEAEAWATLGGRKQQELSPRRESLGYGRREDRRHRIPAPHLALPLGSQSLCESPGDEADPADWS